ncbi:MAG: endoglucanase [Verrucomicrobia bacterium]|nr:endoglucanase [Verrucomicrobiota bacterium]
MSKAKDGERAQTVLPRWRGFNLPDMIGVKNAGCFHEEDFQLVSELGFDFVRLPLCYRNWVKNPGDPDDLESFNEKALAPIDQAVEWGRKYGVHVCLNFHRAPGYSVNRDWPERRSLWKSDKPLPAFKFHWKHFAERYRGISSKQLSFNLLNEPPKAQEPPEDNPLAWVMTVADHSRVMRETVAVIRSVDQDRIIILDGLNYGNDPCPELADLTPGVVQSCRAYWPASVSHWRASWFRGSDKWPQPKWPGAMQYWGDDVVNGTAWNREKLEEHYALWVSLARKGVGVHCGEGGAYNKTPHDVVLAWYRDVLEILTPANIGHALWNFRGSFGILDSDRTDVKYEDWRGHKLDRKLLDLLKEF